jgi:hypothetical protein
MTSLNQVKYIKEQRQTEVDGGDVSVLQDSGRKLLREYSGIRNDEMDNHIETIVSSAIVTEISLALNAD